VACGYQPALKAESIHFTLTSFGFFMPPPSSCCAWSPRA
jgi:hypothetical protein